MIEEKSVSEAQDFNELIRVTVVAGGERVAVAGTGIGPNRVPHLVEVQGRRFTVELEPYVTVFRYADLPGHDRPRRHDLRRARDQHLLGRRRPHARRRPDGEDGAVQRLAAMVVTTDAAVPEAVVDEIVASEGFVDGWAVDLG